MGEEGKVQEEKVRREKINPLELIIYAIFACLMFAWFYPARVLSVAKYWSMAAIWVPFILVLFIATILGKTSPKLRLGATTLLIITYALAINSGKDYYLSAVIGANLIDCTISGGFTSYMPLMVWPTGADTSLAPYMPNWLIPKDVAAAQSYFSGTGSVNWSAFTGPISSWSVMYISYAIFGLTLLFFFLGPHFAEVERLIFPMTIPFVFAANEVVRQDRYGGLFSLKETRLKAFWVAVIIGVVLNTPFIIGQLFPAIPLGGMAGGGYGQWPLLFQSWYPALNEILPGAAIDTTITMTYIFVTALMPVSFIVTMLASLSVFTWLYPTLAIRAGWVPAGGNPMVAMPFPVFYFAWPGMEIGLGLVVLWRIKGRIIRALKTFTGEDYVVHGVSMKIAISILIISGLVFLGFWVAAGVPLLMVIAWAIISLVDTIGGARIWAEYQNLSGCCFVPAHNYMLFPIGAGLGLWSAIPPNAANSALVMTTMLPSLSTCAGPFEGNSVITPQQYNYPYGAGHGIKADLRKVFFAMMTILIIVFPFAFTYNVWFNNHVGLANTGDASLGAFLWQTANWQLWSGVESLTGAPLSPEQFWGVVTAGAISSIAVESLRAYFPWFAISTVAVISGMSQTWWIGWVNGLIALVMKYSLTKVLGPRRAYEMIVPILAGIMCGFVLGYIIVGIVITTTVSIPNLNVLWK